MNFTSLYLSGLQEGMAKQAAGLMGFKPLAPENASITGGAVGAATGAVLGGVSNALIGSSRRNKETGEKENGILARLTKGGLVGAAGGGLAGAVAGPELNAIGSGMISDSASPLHAGVAQSLTVSDLLKASLGVDASPSRQAGLGLEGLTRGGAAAAKQMMGQ